MARKTRSVIKTAPGTWDGASVEIGMGFMPNSRLSVETKVITEGAIMAALTSVLALAGIFIPVINPIVMLIWTLPVVVICIRHGMRAGAITIAVAGIIILFIASPINAFYMLLGSVGPALFIGNGFYNKWSTEKTVFYAAIAAVIGLALDLFISTRIMGISVAQMYSVEPETIEEMVKTFSDSGLMSRMYSSQEELREALVSISDTMRIMIPAGLVLGGVFTALTNYIVAHIVLRRLKEPVPPFTRLAAFRLPMPFLLGFVSGLAMLILGMSYADKPALQTAGQNITAVFLVLYAFQGLGLTHYFIGRFAAPHMQRTFKILLVVGIIMSNFYLLILISFAGVIDAFIDFRMLDIGTIRKNRIL